MGFKLKIIAIVLSAILIGFICLNFYAVPSSGKGEKVLVEIPKGLGLKDIALKLEEAGVIRSDKLFILSVFIKGATGRLKAGEYEFQIGDPRDRIIDKLINGDVVVRRITIPEGFTTNDIAELLEKNNIMNSESFVEKANSTEFTKELFGVSLPSFEGYLFPDTYLYKKGITPEELIRMMVFRFKEVYEPLKANSGELNLKDHEVVILASIIEKETGNT
ncbi:MAG TPA: endolytic transglycosylase MltG, partial [Thermodesulfobacteriota bacterium]|nr:endolytic transglycosylase MltG [Thermodesulfobacteriota bacterium]